MIALALVLLGFWYLWDIMYAQEPLLISHVSRTPGMIYPTYTFFSFSLVSKESLLQQETVHLVS